MAKEAPEDEESGEGAAAAAPAKPGIKKLILIAVGALALVGVSIGGTMLATGIFSKHETATVSKAKKKAKAAKTDEGDNAAADEGDNADNADNADAEGDNADANAEDTGEGGAPVKKEAAYLDFDQPFVVNFMDGDQLRYLQVSVAVMSHDPKMPELVKRHMPLIRNNLVMLFSSRSRDQIISREGKEKIRADAQAEVQKILTEQTGKPVIEALYLTSFVMQ